MSDTSRLATLTATYQQLPLQARHYTLACIGMPPEEDDVLNAVDFAFNEFCNKVRKLDAIQVRLNKVV